MKATVAAMLARLPGPATARWPQGEPFAVALKHGSMSVELYAPRGRDRQTPHTRDELYFVVSGRGEFVHGGRRDPFGPGDTFFVPARQEHRFENFTADFAAWVVFYGPEGGEQS
ncbi:MAG: cupin domain-containing protein [Opitutae bacterium]|nr:cupin domain-containing protein [Opitutae bacterium]